MPPKKKQPDASKKTVQKKKQQIVEDKTFGLKNKNKSKKVQSQIRSIEKNVMNSGDPKLRKLEEERKKAKAEAKLRKKAAEDERNALFGEALLAVQKKSQQTNQAAGKVEAKGRDADDADNSNKKSTSRAMKMMYQMDAQEMRDKLLEDPNYVPTLEDEVEMQRQECVAALKKSGKGTKVTPESFAAWKERKRQQKQAEAKKLVEAELRKKKGGKGLSVLSGRDLFEYKRELFVDQDDDDNYNGLATAVASEIQRDNQSNKSSETANGGGDGGLNEENTMTNGSSSNREEASGVKSDAPIQSELFLQGDDDDLDDLIDEE